MPYGKCMTGSAIVTVDVCEYIFTKEFLEILIVTIKI